LADDSFMVERGDLQKMRHFRLGPLSLDGAGCQGVQTTDKVQGVQLDFLFELLVWQPPVRCPSHFFTPSAHPSLSS
jgi:hypothetical protein